MTLARLYLLTNRSCDDISISVVNDDKEVAHTTFTGNVDCLEFSINNDNDDIHKLDIVLSGKEEQHTIASPDGDILEDHYAEIKQLIIDDIDVSHLFCDGQRCYRHNSNGWSDWVTDEFFGFMGHNGTVSFNYQTPLYKWFWKLVRDNV